MHFLKGSRHPVVEQMQLERGQHFVKNDCTLGNDQRVWILTGVCIYNFSFLL